MLNIQRFVCNMLQENCYVVSDDTKECVIIDCGALYDEERRAIVGYVRDNKLEPKHLICTHAHADHNFGNGVIYREFGLKPEVCAADEPLMCRLREQAEAFVGMNFDEEIPPVGRYFTENDTVSFGNHTVDIISTPGHTPGSVFFYIKNEGLAFSGDTLFKMSIGRTDFALGDYDAIVSSLEKISRLLPGGTIILPGHGDKTTMDYELRNNPYLR